MVKIAILDDWQDVARGSADWSLLASRADLTFFADAFDNEDQAAAALADSDILLTMRERTAFPATLLRRLPKLRMIGITGANVATLDLAACSRQGVVVCNTAGGGSGAPFATAELALGLLIAAARAIPVADATMRAGGFQRGVPVGVSLAGKTLGIVGLGRLGSRMARYGAALDMKVIAWSPNLTEARAEAAGARLARKAELMAVSDAISVHMVLSPRSRGVIGAEDIDLMKTGAILINTSRGPLIDQGALVAAVRAGRINAVLDVYDKEPLPRDHPLRAAGNTVLTPHLGYGVEETWRDFYPRSVENALAFLDGAPIRVLNAS
ncbi:D-2-hydroxyacid dehydrogenase family protein [Roseiarcus sp.]|uniref:D-2-hydroxyacid dehydrogenase family protein n=1 Tax=Roseiarcus sp. TaxID=1969460 RepID=UPI003F9E0895